MDGGCKGTIKENAQVFNSVCDLYGIVQTSSGEGKLKRGSPSYSDIVAFGSIDREVPS